LNREATIIKLMLLGNREIFIQLNMSDLLTGFLDLPITAENSTQLYRKFLRYCQPLSAS